MLKDNKTMVVFSGDLAKALASIIIANGAVAANKIGNDKHPMPLVKSCSRVNPGFNC
ncbi:hypothetical protein DSOL_2815 [Desulfosporosinus metallidurans]|uniref:Uncharacterized protein n=1 Tax=Desulfosporosinus metallidurans TaxID=1888891 RepID=A0A1Q8QV51_9FIRM|nr:hypothetical protein DSOL_2815 [Desulfosporosinus metallidurans]